MNFPLKSPQYENCEVLSPDGQLMFRCCQKKANWYLRKDLGIKLSDHPLRIQLTFVPKGVGHIDDPYFLQVMQNRCVVCGEEKDLNRHHIVPYCYRKFFPVRLKEHRSYDVMPLCLPCHKLYEDYALELKRELAALYEAPLSGVGAKYDRTLGRIKGAASTLRDLSHILPQKRLEALSGLIESHLNRKWEQSDLETLASTNPYDFNNYIHHGKLVVDKVSDINEFVQTWRRHFIKTMNPKFLPNYWTFDRAVG